MAADSHAATIRFLLEGEERTLEGVAPDFETEARAPLIMVVNVRDAGGGTMPLHWVEDLDWKAYTIVFRLHALDHAKQIKKVLAAAGARDR